MPFDNSYFGENTRLAMQYFREVVWGSMNSWIVFREDNVGSLASDEVLVSYERNEDVIRISFTYREGLGNTKIETDYLGRDPFKLLGKSGTDKEAAWLIYTFAHYVQMNGFHDVSH